MRNFNAINSLIFYAIIGKTFNQLTLESQEAQNIGGKKDACRQAK
jgi:hypothetical protein